MLVASNFDEHKFVKSGVGSLTKLGYNIGAKVVVTKRFTVDYGPEKPGTYRADVRVGTELFVKGFTPADGDKPAKLVFEFAEEFKKIGKRTVDVALDRAKFKLPDDSAAAGAASGGKSDPVYKKYPFLKQEGDERQCEVVGTWTKRQMCHDATAKMDLKKHEVGFMLDNIAQADSSTLAQEMEKADGATSSMHRSPK